MTHPDSPTFTLGELAEHLDARLVGDAARRVSGLATLRDAGPDQVAFLSNRAYLKALSATRAAAVLLEPEQGAECPVARLELANPYLAYAAL